MAAPWEIAPFQPPMRLALGAASLEKERVIGFVVQMFCDRHIRGPSSLNAWQQEHTQRDRERAADSEAMPPRVDQHYEARIIACCSHCAGCSHCAALSLTASSTRRLIHLHPHND
jgi:hypothetical protein